jgi:hypothetical protein
MPSPFGYFQSQLVESPKKWIVTGGAGLAISYIVEKLPRLDQFLFPSTTIHMATNRTWNLLSGIFPVGRKKDFGSGKEILQNMQFARRLSLKPTRVPFPETMTWSLRVFAISTFFARVRILAAPMRQ